MNRKPDKAMIDRINELAALSKKRALTEAELAEQKKLREDYLSWFRSALRGETK